MESWQLQRAQSMSQHQNNHGVSLVKALCVHAGILQEAMGRREYWRLVDGQGRPPGLMGMWPSRAVTFIENHDTGDALCSHSKNRLLALLWL